MFAYNPAVTDRSAEILTSANNQAAAIQLQGMQSLGESMANLGQTFSDSISKARENAAKANTNAGVGEAIADVYRTYGTPEQYQDYLSGLDKVSKNQDKAAGYNAVHVQQAEALVELNRSKQIQQAQYDAAKDLYDYKAANSAPAAPKMNSENIRSMVAEAKAAGFTDEAIKSKLQSQYGDWAVRSVYPPQNQGIWMGQ